MRDGMTHPRLDDHRVARPRGVLLTLDGHDALAFSDHENLFDIVGIDAAPSLTVGRWCVTPPLVVVLG